MCDRMPNVACWSGARGERSIGRRRTRPAYPGVAFICRDVQGECSLIVPVGCIVDSVLVLLDVRDIHSRVRCGVILVCDRRRAEVGLEAGVWTIPAKMPDDEACAAAMLSGTNGTAPTQLPSPSSTELFPLPPWTSDSPLIRVQENRGRHNCTASGFLDTRSRYAAWRSSYSSRASSGV